MKSTVQQARLIQLALQQIHNCFRFAEKLIIVICSRSLGGFSGDVAGTEK